MLKPALITDEVLETAGHALFVHQVVYDVDDWDTLDPSFREEWRDDACAVLEAVLPQIAADIWDVGFEAGATWTQSSPAGIPHDPPLNPHDKVKP